MRARRILPGAIVVVALGVSPAMGATVGVTVPGSANPYLAGMPPGSTCCASSGGAPDSAPAQSPVEVPGLPLTPGTVLTFSVSGSVSFSGGVPTDSPDGGVFNTIDTFGLDGTPSSNGISGMLAPQNSLVGLFLDDGVPTSSPALPRLDFSNAGLGMSFPSLCPGLKQPFFIGDGLTGKGSGAVQQFVVPPGAKRFFLATVDGVEWQNNTGSLNVQVTSSSGAAAGPLAAATLPTSRSIQVGNIGFAFATILNIGGNPGVSCGITPTTAVPVTFTFQTTDPSTNAVTGSPNTPAACIVPGGGQTYVIGFAPTQPFPPTEVSFAFQCSNSAAAPVVVGLDTLLLSGSTGPVPDMIAVAATVNHDGIVNIPGDTGTGIFSVATFNLGAGAQITVTADTGAASLPVAVFVCQTDAAGGCLETPATSLTTQIDTNATPTFGVFVQGHGTVPFDPAQNRIFVRFKDGGGNTRGATSAAVRTQ